MNFERLGEESGKGRVVSPYECLVFELPGHEIANYVKRAVDMISLSRGAIG